MHTRVVVYVAGLVVVVLLAGVVAWRLVGATSTYEVALDTYDRVIAVVNRSDLDDAAKEAEVKRLVIAGQERSSARVAEVLDAAQYATYRAWEEKQVKAFQERGLWSDGRRSRRSRP